MITMFIIIFCSGVYLLGWLAIMVLETIVRIIANLFKRLFKIGTRSEISNDDIVEIQTTKDGEWGKL